MPSFKPARVPGRVRREFVPTKLGGGSETSSTELAGFLPAGANGDSGEKGAASLPKTLLELEAARGSAREEGRAEGHAEGLPQNQGQNAHSARTEGGAQPELVGPTGHGKRDSAVESRGTEKQ